MLNNIKTVVVYSTSLCNLNCRYCFFAKDNPQLIITDHKLEESFKGDYYINHLMNTVEDLTTITNMEIWGGETLLNSNRTLGFIEDLIKLCPNFNSLKFSTNLTYDKVYTSIREFVELFAKYPTRKFTIHIQISIDGPEAITDNSRGIGVTKAVLEHYNTLIDNRFFLGETKNVCIHVGCKPTLDIESLKLFLDKEFIIKYFKFFEDEFLSKWEKLIGDNRFLKIYPPVGNFEVPFGYTQSDGKMLNSICALTRAIEEENKTVHYFKYYNMITFFGLKKYNYEKIHNGNYNLNGGFCYSGSRMINLLPDNKFSGCHRVFMDYIEECAGGQKETFYNDKYATNRMIFDDFKSYDKYFDFIKYFHSNSPTSLLVSITTLIQSLAKIGQIDNKYINEHEALAGAKFIIASTGLCICAMLGVSGSPLVLYSGTIKLFLNGARDYIEDTNIWEFSEGDTSNVHRISKRK